VAVARLKFANPLPLVSLKHNPYQVAFMAARRLRVCQNGHQWIYTYTGTVPNLTCPHCGAPSKRGFRRFLLRAGRRGGKTRICALAMIEELTIPYVRWWAAAPTYPMLNDYVLPAFFQQIPQAWLDHPQTDWSESELTLTLPQRAQAQFRSLEDVDRGRGPGLHGLWLDEISLLTLKHWETIRPTLTENRGILIAGTTPRGPDWVHESFYQAAERGQPGFWATHYSTLDNPIIDPEEIEEARASMTDLMFRQEYMADIVTFTGAIYGEILGPCVIEGTEADLRHYFPEWPRLDLSRPSVTGIDPGTDHPFAGLHLVASPRGLVVVGEYEQSNKPYAIHAQRIQDMRRGFDSRVGIDRSQAQAGIELALYGLFTQTADNDVVAGINRVSAWMLASGARKVMGSDQIARPAGLVIPRSLAPKLIKRLEAYRWADNTNRDGSTKRELVHKKDDDLCDALRYALMTYPALPATDPVLTAPNRELVGMPDKMRLEIERIRRIEAQEKRQALEAMAVDGVGEGLIPLADDVLSEYEIGQWGPMGDFNR
jgi:hypothetical protein